LSIDKFMNIIPNGKFQQFVNEFSDDKYIKKFNSFHHFIVLIFAQLNENDSLKDIEHPININKNKVQLILGSTHDVVKFSYELHSL
jgi:hypothetical protein